MSEIGHVLRLLLGSAVLGVILLWTACVIAYGLGLRAPLSVVVIAGLVVVAVIVLLRASERSTAIGVLLAIWALVAVAWQFKRPRVDRTWAPDHARLAQATVTGNQVVIRDLRDASYRTPEDFDVTYYDQTFDLEALTDVWFVIDRFAGFDGAAHTFLSFGFGPGTYVCISAEARREKGESYSPLGGMFKQFELVYILGTERDIIGRRTNSETGTVWMYPIKTTPERRRELFVSMVERANRLREEPVWYHTFARSCNSSVVEHVHALVPGRVPFSWRLLLPGYAGRIAYDLGLIDTELSFEEAQRAFRIDERGRAGPLDDTYSRRIREPLTRD